MKPIKLTYLVITSTLILGGCASTDIERKLENNFIYQCSLKLFDDIDKKITGADAEKICSAAYKAETDEQARRETPSHLLQTVTPTPPVTTVKPAVKEEKPVVPESTDEVKPEPTPKN